MYALVREQRRGYPGNRRVSSMYLNTESVAFSWVSRMPEDEGWLIVPNHIPSDPFYSDFEKMRSYGAGQTTSCLAAQSQAAALRYTRPPRASLGSNDGSATNSQRQSLRMRIQKSSIGGRSSARDSLQSRSASCDHQDLDKQQQQQQQRKQESHPNTNGPIVIFSNRRQSRPDFRRSSQRLRDYQRSQEFDPTRESLDPNANGSGASSAVTSDTDLSNGRPSVDNEGGNENSQPITRDDVCRPSSIRSTATASTVPVRRPTISSSTESEETVVGHGGITDAPPVPPKPDPCLPPLMAQRLERQMRTKDTRHHRRHRRGLAQPSTSRSQEDEGSTQQQPANAPSTSTPSQPNNTANPSSTGTTSVPSLPQLPPEILQQISTDPHSSAFPSPSPHPKLGRDIMDRSLPPIQPTPTLAPGSVINTRPRATSDDRSKRFNTSSAVTSVPTNTDSPPSDRHLSPSSPRGLGIGNIRLITGNGGNPTSSKGSPNSGRSLSGLPIAGSLDEASSPRILKWLNHIPFVDGSNRHQGNHYRYENIQGSKSSFSLLKFRHISDEGDLESNESDTMRRRHRPRSLSVPLTPLHGSFTFSWRGSNKHNAKDKPQQNPIGMVSAATISTGGSRSHNIFAFVPRISGSTGGDGSIGRWGRHSLYNKDESDLSLHAGYGHRLASKFSEAIRKLRRPLCPFLFDYMHTPERSPNILYVGDTNYMHFSSRSPNFATSLPNLLHPAESSRCEKCGRYLKDTRTYARCENGHVFCNNCIEAHAMSFIASGSLRVPCASISPCPAWILHFELERCLGSNKLRNRPSLLPERLRSGNNDTATTDVGGFRNTPSRAAVAAQDPRTMSSHTINDDPSINSSVTNYPSAANIHEILPRDSRTGHQPHIVDIPGGATATSEGVQSQRAACPALALPLPTQNPEPLIPRGETISFDLQIDTANKDMLEQDEERKQQKRKDSRRYLNSLRLSPISLSSFFESGSDGAATPTSASSKDGPDSDATASNSPEHQRFSRGSSLLRRPVPPRTSYANRLALTKSMGTWVTPGQIHSGYFNDLALYADALDYFTGTPPHKRRHTKINYRGVVDLGLTGSSILNPRQRSAARHRYELSGWRDHISSVDPKDPESLIRAIDNVVRARDSADASLDLLSHWSDVYNAIGGDDKGTDDKANAHRFGDGLDTNLDFLAPSSASLREDRADKLPEVSRLGPPGTVKTRGNSARKINHVPMSITDASAQLWLDALDWNHLLTKESGSKPQSNDMHSDGRYYPKTVCISPDDGTSHNGSESDALWFQLSSLSQQDLPGMIWNHWGNKPQRATRNTRESSPMHLDGNNPGGNDGDRLVNKQQQQQQSLRHLGQHQGSVYTSNQNNHNSRPLLRQNSTAPTIVPDLLESVQLNADLYVQLKQLAS
ncbi:hypothetical protein EV182_001105 [Spiromyces aspiralis]|uniref:Uncharacterized protein n=1 Tax=Spiromyces aspiralis TaxID=68401 RepID=A0ACC1HNL1_9FUNG|nr:hypothetical protein EV182_001105 [Spiromyces aspiralis]